ncbi:MAG: serine/threonine-protein kinase, partial [Rhodothermales bacterium]|nr:serine/threonine-protein kinase [Rhodothermales bacterium]
MDPPRWPQINALLDAVLALPPAERRAYLDAHSPDPAVRREVESLLAAHDEAGSFLDAPAGTYAAGLLEDPPDPLVGQEIDGYRLLRVLGRGGMGVVYEAEDLALGRHVALKMIVPALARDASFVRRFQDEARTLARIESPHIVQVHALRRTDAGLFIVMEYVDGGTVKDRMEAGPMPWAQARPLVLQMLTALEHAHGVGVIHRDIKPGNLLLTRSGTVKVTDFGLAKVYEGEDAATLTQGIAGTLNYMAPEQVLGRRDLGPPADLYALGLTIYHLLAGRLPFDAGGGEYAVMQSIVESDFPPPSQFEP